MPKPLAVLIVEDSESDAQLVVRLLQKAGYKVTHDQVDTSEGMRASLKKRAWDIVISDYSLPQFDGMAALSLLKETGLDIPFIVVSGTMGEETAVAMMKAGAHDYLTAGSYTVTANVSGVATPASFNLANTTAAVTGALNGSGTSSIALANLTSEGTTDWVHWGDPTLSRKVGVTAQLSSYTRVGTVGATSYSPDLRPLSWTDGTPAISSTNNTNGVYISGIGNGFSFTAPADVTTRTLTVHVGAWNSGGNTDGASLGRIVCRLRRYNAQHLRPV